LYLLLDQCLRHAIHLIEHVFVDSDDMMQRNGMLFGHPEAPVLELL
jgi:hypothetical protein